MITETIVYRAPDGREVSSYLARPEGNGPYPAILMCYELLGMAEVPGGGPHMRDIAGRFANEGYVAIVPDFYAIRGLFPRMEGGTIVGGPPDEEADRDLCAGVGWLQSQPYVRPTAIGTIGWCGGGRHALFLTARCPEIRAAASFYGRPVNRAPTERQPLSPIELVAEMRCPIFGAYGEDDRGIPAETVRQLQTELQRQGKTHQIHLYAGAGHAFMNDQRDTYHEPSATDAWRRVLEFFAEHLKDAVPAGV